MCACWERSSCAGGPLLWQELSHWLLLSDISRMCTLSGPLTWRGGGEARLSAHWEGVRQQGTQTVRNAWADGSVHGSPHCTVRQRGTCENRRRRGTATLAEPAKLLMKGRPAEAREGRAFLPAVLLAPLSVQCQSWCCAKSARDCMGGWGLERQEGWPSQDSVLKGIVGHRPPEVPFPTSKPWHKLTSAPNLNTLSENGKY